MEGLCNHPEFYTTVEVNRIEDTLSYVVDLRIRCIECGMPFRFKDLPRGISVSRATCSLFGNEASLPIEPMEDVPQEKWEAMH